MNDDLYSWLIGQHAAQQPVADYGFNPDTGMPNQPVRQDSYQPAQQQGWKPQAARVPESTLGIGQQPVLPYPPSVDRGSGGWSPMAATLPQSSVRPVDPSQVYQPPLNSMMSSGGMPNYVPSPSLGSPVSDGMGPAYDQEAQSKYSSPLDNFIPSVDRSASGIGYSEAERGGPWGGIQASPYAALDNFMSRDPVHTLGYQGAYAGGSGPSVDNSGPMQRQQAIRNNMQISDMLGHQNIARQNNTNELMKTMLMANERGDSSRDRETNKFWGILEKTPEGMRAPLVEQGVQQGHITKDVGKGMLLDEMMKRAMMGAKDRTSNVVDVGKLLGSLQSEFDPNKLSRSELIKRIQMAGIKPGDIEKQAYNPQVSDFAKSLLGPESQGIVPDKSMMDWILR